MTNNKRNAKKQQREISSVKAADETPTASVTSEVPPQTEAPTVPDEQVDPLMAEVEAFLSKRDELAQKIAEEIEATELKLAELKKTAASLFPDSGSNGTPSAKPKKPKPKPVAKAESASTTEGESAAE